MIPRLTHPWHPGAYPYEVFAAAGLTPQTPHGAVLDLSLQLQAQNKMDRTAREAFDALRTLPSRLAVDFFLFNPDLCDPQAQARQAVQVLARELGKGTKP